MAGARERYFPVEADDRVGDRLLQNNGRRPSIEYRPPPPRARPKSGSSSTGADSSEPDKSAKPRRRFISLWVFSLIIIGIAVMFLLGVCVGFYVRELQTDKPDFAQICGLTDDEDKEAELNDKLGGYHESLVYYVRAKGIKDFVELFGPDDPTTGDIRDERLVDAVLADFQKYVVGSVAEEKYDVVVTSPDPRRPNELEVLHQNGSRLQHYVFEGNGQTNRSSEEGTSKTSRTRRRYNRENQERDVWKFPHVAFSPAGVVEGPLVYAHFGRETDFLVLQALGVTVPGSVVMLRMGRLPVAQMIRRAETHKAKAVLLYWRDTDVLFDVKNGLNSSSFVPFASALDPSLDMATSWRPSIPCQTVSADQADDLLTLAFDPTLVNSSDLVQAPRQWQGFSQSQFAVGLKERADGTWTNYTIVRVSVYNRPKKRQIINVVSTIQGVQEPDRYVIVGAPRASLPGQPQDAVVSTSILLQLARAFSHVHRLHTWLPRRGIKLVSWGGSELSDLGMVEMVRKQHHLLDQRMMTYFDLRHLVMGNATILANIPASMRQLFDEVASGVPDPRDAEQTLHMTWKDSTSKGFPLGGPRGDQTYNPFLHLLGIPTVHLQYAGPDGSVSLLSETSRQEHHHHYKYHLALTRMMTLALLTVLDNRLLPFDLSAAAHSLHDTVWQTSQGLEECSQDKHSLKSALHQCEQLDGSAQAFYDLTQHYLGQGDQTSLISLNNIAMLFDRLFVVRHEGWPQHLLYPVLSDGSLAIVSEMCQAGDIIGDWNLTSQFQGIMVRVLTEAQTTLQLGA